VERQSADGQWQELNAGALLPGLITSPLGGEYALVDPDARRGQTYTYRLVEEDMWNSRHVYGPWTVTIGDNDHSGEFHEMFSVKRAQGVKKVHLAHEKTTFFRQWQSLATGFSGRARSVAPPFKNRIFKTSFDLSSGTQKVYTARKKRINRVRLKTRDTAMYQVSVDDLAAATAIAPARITRKLAQGRWSFSTEDGPASYFFDRAEQRVVFAADRHQTIETLDNVYRLGKFRHKQGWKMNTVTGAGPDTADIEEPGQFRDTQYFAEENYLLTWIHSDEDADYGYWAMVYSAPTGSATLTVNLPDPASTSAREGNLKIVLRGASNTVEGDDHLARVMLNGTPLNGEVQWDGTDQAVLEVPFAQSLLAGTENGELAAVTLEVQGEVLSNAAHKYSLFYIESVEFSYDRKMYAQDNALRIHDAPQGVVTVSGFSSIDIQVIEAPNTPDAAWRKNLTISEAAGGGYQVSFVSTGGDYQLSAAPVTVMPEPDYPSRLLSRRNRAEYLIIAPRSLQQSAEALSDYRATLYRTQIIWLQDIYDVFSGGRVDSEAIEEFLAYVHSHWQQVPEYVVLFGRGTLDHPDRKGFGESMIPLRMAATPWGLIGSDNRYADVDGDYVPDFSIGRIAVSTNAAGLAYVDKLTAYDTEPAADWTAHAAVVADDPDPDAGDFHANSDQIAAILTGYNMTVDKLYHPDGQVRNSLLANWAAGEYGFVNYDGHGGRTQLGKSSENFLKAGDVAALRNGSHLPVFSALTCAAGDSSYPGMLSLGDTLSLQADGGAVAAFVPTGLSLDGPAHQLNIAFVNALVGEGKSVGMAARSALEEADISGMVPFMFDVYNVAGDPAVKMKRLEGYRISDGVSLEIKK